MYVYAYIFYIYIYIRRSSYQIFEDQLAADIFRALQPLSWPERIVVRFLEHTVNPAEPLETWLIKCIDAEAGIIDIDIDRSMAWLAETAAAAAKAKKKAKRGEPLDDGDYVGAILAGRPLDMGELVDTRGGGGDCGDEHVMEFMELLDAEAEEEEGPHDPIAGVPGVAAADGEIVEADMAVSVAGVDADFVVDHDFIDEIVAIGAAASSSSSSSDRPSVAAEPLPELLARLKLAHKSDSLKFPRDILDLDGPLDADGKPQAIGKMYCIWGKTIKGECKCHKSCALMVNASWFASASSKASDAAGAAQKVTYEWLARGRCTSEQEHFSEAQEVLRRCRYKPEG